MSHKVKTRHNRPSIGPHCPKIQVRKKIIKIPDMIFNFFFSPIIKIQVFFDHIPSSERSPLDHVVQWEQKGHQTTWCTQNKRDTNENSEGVNWHTYFAGFSFLNPCNEDTSFYCLGKFILLFIVNKRVSWPFKSYCRQI